jgi:predicted nucleic acid-binding protein
MNEYAVWAGPLMALATLAYAIVTNRTKAHGQQIGAIQNAIAAVERQVMSVQGLLNSRLDVVEDRVVKVEATMAHLPSKDTTHHLELSMAEMRGELRTLAERIKPIAAISDRIQDAVLEKVTG